jgi:hypothetical protein
MPLSEQEAGIASASGTGELRSSDGRLWLLVLMVVTSRQKSGPLCTVIITSVTTRPRLSD